MNPHSLLSVLLTFDNCFCFLFVSSKIFAFFKPFLLNQYIINSFKHHVCFFFPFIVFGFDELIYTGSFLQVFIRLYVHKQLPAQQKWLSGSNLKILVEAAIFLVLFCNYSKIKNFCSIKTLNRWLKKKRDRKSRRKKNEEFFLVYILYEHCIYNQTIY